LAHRLKFCDFLEQLAITRIEKVTENVNFVLILLRREFGAGDEFNIDGLSSRGRPLATFQGIVIRQRNGRQPMLRGIRHQFLRRIRAVGKVCVQM